MRRISNRLHIERLENRLLLAGELDPTFGDNGQVSYATDSDLPNSPRPTKFIIQPDSRIVVATSRREGTDQSVLLARFTDDGVVDTSFGVNGETSLQFGLTSQFRDIVQQPNGRFVIVAGTNEGTGIARFLHDGALDDSFGGDGTITIENLFSSEAVEVTASGKILILDDDLNIYSFNPNGSRDASFGVAGVATLPDPMVPDGNPSSRDFDIQPDGKIAAVGNLRGDSQAVIWRLNSDGTADTSFSEDGIAGINNQFMVPNAVEVQPDGRIVIVGTESNNFVAYRLHTDSRKDLSFGAQGKQTVNFQSESQPQFRDQAFDVSVDSDSRVLVVGQAGPNQNFGVARILPTGGIDTTFGTGGRVEIDFAASSEVAYTVEIVGGKILVGGGARVNGDLNIALVRLNSSSRPTNLLLSDTSIPEGQPAGTVVGTFSSIDNDPGDTFTYSLVSGAGATNNGAFQIVGNQLRTKFRLNFEIKDSFNIRVRSTDSQNNFLDRAFTITVEDVSEAPVLGGISGSVGYQQDTTAILLAPQATATDADSQNFAGGKLTLSISSGAADCNRLITFGIEGTNVVRNGITIGTLTGDGVGTNNFEITFNANATVGVVQQVLRSIRFRTDASAITGPRQIDYTLTDSDGNTSNLVSKTVNVSP